VKATIKDVARAAGVSVATVSRVLNGSGYFDKETARRVRDAVTKLDYRKNIHWTRLSRNSSETVCFLLGNRESMNSMQMKMLVACERRCAELGLDVVFTSFRYPAEARPEELALPKMLVVRGMVDGVILAGHHTSNLLEALKDLRIPWVLSGNNFVGRPADTRHFTVNYDEAGAIEDAARCLLRHGHRQIAFIGNQRYHWFRRRLETLQGVLTGCRATLQMVTDDWDLPSIEYGRLAAAQLMRMPRPPTAILAANDEVAAGAWKELVHRGVRIPADLSLMGFGDREEFQILEPSLTSISVFPDRLGLAMAEMLGQRLSDPQTRIASRVFPCQLMERASCGPAPSRLAVAGQ